MAVVFGGALGELAVVGRRLLNVAEWSSITTLSGHSAAVTGVKFGANAASLVTVSADKNINVYSQ
jgi:WD40 repeat protein